MDDLKGYQNIAKEVRKQILDIIYQTRSPHIGSCFSMVEILVALYFRILSVFPENANNPNRDRFILSKGHGCPALCAVLAKKGILSKKVFDLISKDGGLIGTHPDRNVEQGIEITSGSLGHGLSLGVGMALAAKNDKKNYRVFVFLGDGELEEGSNWEAIMFAAHHKLDNLIAIVDYNKLQILGRVSDVMKLEPLRDKWRSFGWEVKEVNGHNFKKLLSVFKKIPFKSEKPSVVIANTIKGKGVSFMENELRWHDRCPNDEEYKKALEEIQKI